MRVKFCFGEKGIQLSDGGKGKKKRKTVPFMQESWNGEVEYTNLFY